MGGWSGDGSGGRGEGRPRDLSSGGRKGWWLCRWRVWGWSPRSRLPELKNRCEGRSVGREEEAASGLDRGGGRAAGTSPEEGGTGQLESLAEAGMLGCGRQSGESPWRRERQGQEGEGAAPFSHQTALETLQAVTSPEDCTDWSHSRQQPRSLWLPHGQQIRGQGGTEAQLPSRAPSRAWAIAGLTARHRERGHPAESPVPPEKSPLPPEESPGPGTPAVAVRQGWPHHILRPQARERL